MMNPPQVKMEDDVAEAIELWEEKLMRLARHGDGYQLTTVFKQVALKKILVGKIRETFELWETDKYPFEDLLRKTKDLARARRLDTDVARGKSGVAVGALDGPSDEWGESPISGAKQARDNRRATRMSTRSRKVAKVRAKARAKERIVEKEEAKTRVGRPEGRIGRHRPKVGASSVEASTGQWTVPRITETRITIMGERPRGPVGSQYCVDSQRSAPSTRVPVQGGGARSCPVASATASRRWRNQMRRRCQQRSTLRLTQE